MPIVETVTGAVVAVKLVGLAVLLQFGLVLVDLLGARRAVVIAEQAEQRAREILGHVDRRDRCLLVQLFLAHHDTSAPKFDAGVNILLLAGIDEGVPPARARTIDADLAVMS